MAKMFVDPKPKKEPKYSKPKSLIEKAKDCYKMAVEEKRHQEEKTKAKTYKWWKEHLIDQIQTASKKGEPRAIVRSDQFSLDIDDFNRLTAEPVFAGIRFEIGADEDYQIISAQGWAE